MKTLVELKAAALVVENKEALANTLIHTITKVKKITRLHTARGRN